MNEETSVNNDHDAYPRRVLPQGIVKPNDPTEEVLAKERKFTGRVFAAEVMDVRLQDGSFGKREIVCHNGGAAIIPVDKDLNVYVVRQFRSPFGQVLVEIPAGKLERDEDPCACAIRELKEETGLVAEHVESLGYVFSSPGYSTEVLYLYLATGLSQEERSLDEGEFLNVEKIPLKELVEQADEGQIRDAKTLVAVLKTARRMGL